MTVRSEIRGALRGVIVVVIAGTFSMLPTHAWAWKPVTHIHLAEQAFQDANDDGKVTIYATDYAGGVIKKDSQGQPIEIGRYSVNPAILSAIRSYPDQFRAGLLGPDAYPDIMTGQQIIHPAGANTDGQPANVDVNVGGPGPDPWLDYLWRLAYGTNGSASIQTPQVRSFVAGYLAHAAGDIYAHTLINHYTGGPFHFTPNEQENAIKHVVLEGYLGKRTPPVSSLNVSISGVSDFLYGWTINATPSSTLGATLLRGSNAHYSIPFIFSKMRAKLEADIDAYYNQKQRYDDRYAAKVTAAHNCRALDFSCSATKLYAQAVAIQAEKAAYVVTNGPGVTYKEAWREDIDSGLRAWPRVSHDLAQALLISPSGMNVDAAKNTLDDYVKDHLLSMAGLPDFVGASLSMIDDVLNALGIEALKDAIHEMKSDLLNYLLKRSFGITLDTIRSYATNPENHFDSVMGGSTFNTEGTGHPVNLAEFNSRELHLTDTAYNDATQRFDYRTFPAAYNSIVMIKLAFMSKSEANRLIQDLGGSYRYIRIAGMLKTVPSAFTKDNAMLGFVKTLDGGNQHQGMALQGQAYTKIFMRQTGETFVSGTVTVAPMPQVYEVSQPKVITPSTATGK